MINLLCPAHYKTILVKKNRRNFCVMDFHLNFWCQRSTLELKFSLFYICIELIIVSSIPSPLESVHNIHHSAPIRHSRSSLLIYIMFSSVWFTGIIPSHLSSVCVRDLAQRTLWQRSSVGGYWICEASCQSYSVSVVSYTLDWLIEKKIKNPHEENSHIQHAALFVKWNY